VSSSLICVESFSIFEVILYGDKNETVVKYSNIDNKTIFASKYKLYLPSIEELKQELEKEKMVLKSEKK
jgi:hypothetical protein